MWCENFIARSLASSFLKLPKKEVPNQEKRGFILGTETHRLFPFRFQEGDRLFPRSLGPSTGGINRSDHLWALSGCLHRHGAAGPYY